jgi:SAM-dependent methyltransferase
MIVASLTPDELGALSALEWEAFGEGAPLLERELFAWEKRLFADWIRTKDSVLVVGAGTGRDVMPLLEAGHAITALDIAPRALEKLRAQAVARGLPVETLHASIAAAELRPESFDVVLFSWFSFAYLQGVEARRSALARSATALRSGGRILLSYPLRGPARPSASPAPWLAAVAARFLGGVRAEKGDEFMVSGTAKEPGVFFTHAFEPAEIEEEAAHADLAVRFHDQPTSGVGVVVFTRKGETSK